MSGYLGPPYDHDVFVSYAHGVSGGEGIYPLKEWSSALADRLWADLAIADPDLESLSIWDDRQIDPTAALTEHLKGVVERAAILLVVMSPPYLRSAWCCDEREWFGQQVTRRSGGNGRDGRVFVVRAISTSHSAWPDFLKDSRGHADVGFRFHEDTREPGIFPYGWPKPDLVDRAFYRALDPLRTAMIRRLHAIRAELDRKQAERPVPVLSPGARARLYLHAPATAPGEVREGVTVSLRAEGCRVIDPVPQDTGAVAIEAAQRDSAARIAAAGGCDALAMLRAPGDEAFEDEALEIAFDEAERIASRRGRRLPCAILDADGSAMPSLPLLERKGVRRFDVRAAGWARDLVTWVHGQQAVAPA